MDTITHGIAGALLGKSLFGGRDLFSPPSLSKQRIITWSLMLGAIFPDSDVLRELFSKNDLLLITWHRSITHSLLCLPIWTGLLAALTLAVVRWRKWPAPSFVALCGLWAIGILSHIFLDLVTTYGTMIWSPLAWSRPAWDLIFIVDFTLTAIFLIPQLLAWVNEDPAHQSRRAFIMWLVFTPVPVLISKIAQFVGAPISNAAIFVATALFAVLFLLPALCGWGSRVAYANWNRAGLVLSCAYILAALFAHRAALARVQEFVARENIQAQAIGALPLPPSLWHWDGLVRAPRGVYEMRMDLSEGLLRSVAGHSSADAPDSIQHSYFPDAFPNAFIDRARQLPEVQKVLWFQRFSLTRSHPEGSNVIVEFSDLRFPQVRPDRPASFTYRVRFSQEGAVLSQGWVKQ